MKMKELTKYQKSRMCRCIYCGREITEFQDFEFTSTKFGRCNVYVFIHSDCIVAAQDWLKDATSDRLQKAAAIGAVRYYAESDSCPGVKFDVKDYDEFIKTNVERSDDDGK